MDIQYSQVFFPKTLGELFASWVRFPGAAPFAGGTGIIYGQGKHSLELPSNIIVLDRLDELRHITRSERYLEIGAMVRLSDILRLGKVLPQILREALSRIANPQLRNIATIGGNICYPRWKLDTTCALVALDAQYELRTGSSSRWVSATRFSSQAEERIVNSQELFTRLRIPLEHWDYTVYRKFTANQFDSEYSGSMAFVARAQKNILSEVRLVFSGETMLRDKNSESILAGKLLPLNRREERAFTELWEKYLAAVPSPNAVLKTWIINFIESTIRNLA
ncbi:MAG: FAD binding domain-containing protein [Spirochaetaceae bacterium]|jgi:CO/xanthine dehydrogenase FAD-binding subunit|nr:FAD binding domain-containing protein [Spirochaetaceae bacterium]